MANKKNIFIKRLKEILGNTHTSNSQTEIKNKSISDSKPESQFSQEENLTYNEILKFSSGFSTPEYAKKEKIWEKLTKNLTNETKVYSINKSNRAGFIWPAAASLVMLLSITSVFYFNRTGIISEAGEHKNVILPDSSEIFLNAVSEIAYNKFTYKWNRKIKLSGEAFLKVKKGNTFKVYANNSVTTVLGTSFNIYARNKDLIVSCSSGKVKVSLPGFKQEKIIEANQEVRKLNNSKLSEAGEFSPEAVIGWQKGKFVYQRKQLSKVFEEIERQYKVEVQCLGCEGRTFSGYFYNNNLEETLTIICLSMQLKFSIDNNIIKITNVNSN